MNQKRIDKLIPLAFQILEENITIQKMFQEDSVNKKMKSAYKGYMSSIGPSIVQAGLIKTLTAFSKKGGSEEDKTITLGLIKELLKNDGYYTTKESNQGLEKIIIERVKNNNSTSYRLKEEDRILEAITAYKLVFDTFEKCDKKDKKREVKNAG